MPIYEYECLSCNDRSEAIQRLSDPPLETCRECGGELRKLLSAPAIQFKGEGWYVTDYADKNKKGEKDKDKGAEAKGDEAKGDKAKGDKAKDSTSKSETSSEKKSSAKKDSAKSSSKASD